VQLQVTPGAGGGYVFEGPWALLRLIERVRVEPGASADRMVLAFDVEGRKARFEVRSPNGPNPLLRKELEQFQCPKRL
jgi:type VI secretion system protein ImpL